MGGRRGWCVLTPLQPRTSPHFGGRIFREALPKGLRAAGWDGQSGGRGGGWLHAAQRVGGTSTPIAGGNPALWSRTPIGPRPAGGCPTPCRRVRPPPTPGWLGAACTHPADVGEGFDRRGRKAAGLPPAPCLSLPPVQGAQLPNEHPLSHPHFYFDLISRDSAAERGPKSHREGRGGGGGTPCRSSSPARNAATAPRIPTAGGTGGDTRDRTG